MVFPDKSQIEATYRLIGGKWCVSILMDMFMGHKRFTDFLEKNPDLSTKMLAQRLSQMQKSGLIRKKYNKQTSGHDYVLAEKGLMTQKILFEMARFSSNAPDTTK